LKLYKLEYQEKDKVGRKITWLLEKDRFVCWKEQREISSSRLINDEADAEKWITDVEPSIPGARTYWNHL